MINNLFHTGRVETLLRTLSIVVPALIVIIVVIFFVILLNVPLLHINDAIVTALFWPLYILPVLSLILSIMVLAVKIIIHSPQKLLAITNMIVSIAIFLLDLFLWFLPTYWNG